ncbi:MAG: nucleotidyltransferase family protein [Lachnospiraceae bacterium]|nr:nucleotidyltransferase family protein [Lachnospiraceae bacterium]
MSTVAIIAEFNPFHNGHKYLFDEAKRVTGADNLVVVMSGDFVQRGAPAITDKRNRTLFALEMGADAVFELPARYATASAPFFARAAVRLIENLGICDYLCFGSETGKLLKLQEYIEMEKENPDVFVENHLGSNDILGIEYIKAIEKRQSLIPVSIKRIEGDEIYTASLIRGRLLENFEDSVTEENNIFIYKDNKFWNSFPELVANRIFENQREFMCSEDMISDILYERILYYIYKYEGGCEDENNTKAASKSIASEGLSKYCDVSEQLANRIVSNIDKYENFRQFAMLLKTKNYTYTRVCRALLHIALEIEKSEDELLGEYSPEVLIQVSYARLLGAKSSSTNLLKEIKIPIVNKLGVALKNEDGKLSSKQLSLLKEDVRVSELYRVLAKRNYGISFPSEFSTPAIIVGVSPLSSS